MSNLQSMTLGDDGKGLVYECGQDVSTITNQKFKFVRPDGTHFEVIPTVYNTTKLRYVASAAELNQLGYFVFNPYGTLGGSSVHGVPPGIIRVDPLHFTDEI